jgi:3-hydroxyacyl-CoA dehydrogenase
MSVVSYEVVENVGVIKVNYPPVNALSQPVREGILTAVTNAKVDGSEALVLICEGRTFIAGADITEFAGGMGGPSLHDVVHAMDQAGKPVVAAIHGTALGGGLETSLGAHYRIALSSAKLGLPEVNLGLLPGGAGTQRVPRLVGPVAALDMMITGKPISAAKALEIGLVDKVVVDDLQGNAVRYAKELAVNNAELRIAGEMTVDPASIPAGLFESYEQILAVKAKGQMAPQHIVKCIKAAVELPIEEGLKVELKLFLECMASPQSAALRHIFFAERMAAKIAGIGKETPLREIKKVGIIGGGTMGGGIAMNFANVGIAVTMLEISDQALARGLAIVKKNYDISAGKGRLSVEKAEQLTAMITGTTSYDDLGDVDLVIEAVFENLDIKKQVFEKLDSVCKPGAILASNTSFQDLNAIAGATSRPQDVVGLHFFSPANVMKLLEVVRGAETSDDVLATAMKLAKTIRKTPVLSGVCHGFIGNRMVDFYGREAALSHIEGTKVVEIDAAMENFGMAMGPLAMADLAGLDIGYKVREVMTSEQKGNPATYCIADALVEQGRLGQKSGSGYYTYDAKTRKRSPDEVIEKLASEKATEQGITRGSISEQEIQNRCIYALVNEAANILQEGIAQRPSDIDIVYVYGYGFPAYKGGPMFYADSVGLKHVYNTICEFAEKFGEEYWQPAPLLKELAEKDSSFTQWAMENGK